MQTDITSKGLRDPEEDQCEPQRFKFLCHGIGVHTQRDNHLSKIRTPCGCAAYMWLCGIVCVVSPERESESESERGRGRGEGERNNPSSKPLDKHSTPIDRH